MRENFEAEDTRKRKLEADELDLSLEVYNNILRESEQTEAARRRQRRRVNVGAAGETRRDVISIPRREQYPAGTVGAMMQRTRTLPQAGIHGERTQRNAASSSSSTPALQAYRCPCLGDHIIIFTTLNSVTRMFYKSHGRSGMQGPNQWSQRIFDLFTDIWFESKGFTAVSNSHPRTRTLQKYSWSDDFLLEEDFEQNLRFFVNRIVRITSSNPNSPNPNEVEEARRAVIDFCETYSPTSLTTPVSAQPDPRSRRRARPTRPDPRNDVLSVLLRTLCKSNDNSESWRIAVQLSMSSETQPLFFSTALGQLFWRLQSRKLYDMNYSDRHGFLLSQTQESLDNSHLLLDNDFLLESSEPFWNNILQPL